MSQSRSSTTARNTRGAQREGVGLSSMHERAEELGGVAPWRFHQRAAPGCLPSTAGEGVRRLETLRVLVAEDHPLFRKGMIALLSSVPEFEVVGEAATGEEAVARAAQLQPDVILMDLQMPEVSGIEAAEIMQESPNVRVLVVTLFEDEESVFMAKGRCASTSSRTQMRRRWCSRSGPSAVARRSSARP